VRIRSIKPEFWTSEDVAELDWPTRLLFIGLWSYVDDNGVGRDIDKLIKAALFPLEDDPRETLATVSRGLQTLSEGGQIDRYTVDGLPFFYINAWERHQRIDKPNKARYPSPTCGNAVPRESVATSSRDPRETPAPGAGEQRSRGTEEKGLLPDKSGETDNRFEEFWDTYDKKVGRKKAETAYAAALRLPFVTPDLLITAAASYIAWQTAEGKHPQYTKNPLSWLNGEHWADERTGRAAPQTRVGQHMALVAKLAAEEAAPRQIGPWT
jgi:hypothetical protein